MFKTRVFTALTGIPLLIGSIFLGKIFFAALILLIILLAQFEFYSILKNDNVHPKMILGLITGGLFPLGAFFKAGSGIEGVLILTIIIYFIWYLLALGNQDIVLDCALTMVGVLYISLSLSFLILIYSISDNGKLFVLTVFIGTWVTDTSAYIFGRLFGKRKLAPAISPSKTWEGFIAGFFLSTLVVGGLFFVPSLSLMERIGLGAIIGTTAQLGDLIESKLKRILKVKDTGWILPGHGGVLDRFDSLIASGIVSYVFFSLIL
ncbi:MAG: phosphatidate cytidylyltransferase [Actinobacteria bacterium]|nr:phosphatidate cytidylyltransferase [Actinomycetota bacterium]